MAFGPRGRFGLGATPAGGFAFPGTPAPSKYASAAQLRQTYFPTGYPSDVISRLPDSATFLTGTAGISSVPLGGGTFLAPIDASGHYATNSDGVIGVWNASGQLVSQFDVGGATNPSAPQYATSYASAYDPSSPAFGLDIQLPGGAFARFSQTLAVSVAGRMANLGEDQATATIRAQAAAAKLNLAVTEAPATGSGPANTAAQFQGHVTDATNAANGLILQFPLATAMLANAVAQLKLSGPGVPALVSTVLPELEQQRQTAIASLKALIGQWAAAWQQDVTAIASDPNGAKITADLNAGNDAINQADQRAIAQLTASAASLLQQAGGQEAASQQGASSGTTQTVSSQGGTTEATTSPGGTPTDTGTGTGATAPAAAGFSGTAALVLGLGVVGAILASRKGKR